MPAMRDVVEPMECKAVEKLPHGEGCMQEIKFDGYRAIGGLLLKAAGDMFDAMPQIFHFHRASA
jgi:hypothetical protein